MANNYNDALERAKQAIIDCGSNASRKEMIYGIFPELRESEDERIRKELIDILKKSYEFGGFTLNNKKDLDRYLSYFEEQRCKERYDRMAPIYKDEESFESALDKAWKFYNESASATVDGFEDNAFELAFAKGFREGFLCKESQKEQKFMREDGFLSLNVKTLEYIYNVCKGCMKQMSKEEFVKCVMSTIPKESVWEKAEKPAGQDYSGLSEFERAIHRGFLCAGVENVPVGIIKDTAKEILGYIFRDEEKGKKENSPRKLPQLARVKATGKIVRICNGQLSSDCRTWIKYASDNVDGFRVYNPEDLEFLKY